MSIFKKKKDSPVIPTSPPEEEESEKEIQYVKDIEGVPPAPESPKEIQSPQPQPKEVPTYISEDDLKVMTIESHQMLRWIVHKIQEEA